MGGGWPVSGGGTAVSVGRGCRVSGEVRPGIGGRSWNGGERLCTF